MEQPALQMFRGRSTEVANQRSIGSSALKCAGSRKKLVSPFVAVASTDHRNDYDGVADVEADVFVDELDSHDDLLAIDVRRGERLAPEAEAKIKTINSVLGRAVFVIASTQ